MWFYIVQGKREEAYFVSHPATWSLMLEYRNSDVTLSLVRWQISYILDSATSETTHLEGALWDVK